jgi:hypothetical protein
MAGQNHIWQNHADPPFTVLSAMILSCHDSVGLLHVHKKSSQLANNLGFCGEPHYGPERREAYGLAWETARQ